MSHGFARAGSRALLALAALALVVVLAAPALACG